MMTKSQQLINDLSDWEGRLNSLYWVQTEKGERVPFRFNRAQQHFWDNFSHPLNIILKARQLGFTTFIQIFMLDAALFNPDVHAGTIAHTREDAEDIFSNKIKFAYDNIPEGIKNAVQGKDDSARKLSFSNGSSIRVGTSLRSGTYQYLHVSEFGKLCAKYPEKAREVVTGALNTIHAGQVAFIESTAEGREGKFFEMCQTARNAKRMGEKLTPLDWRFHFYSWPWKREYRLQDNVVVTDEDREYFETLESLTDEQKAWYIKKKVTQLEDMKREFPSTPDEAFEASVQGAYYAKEMARIRENKQIRPVPWEPKKPVNTFWDLGRNDFNVIWFHQHINGQHRMIDYLEHSGEGLSFYAKALKDKPYTYGKHYLPHDVEMQTIGEEKVRKVMLEDLGVRPIKAVRRALQLGDDIQAVRSFLPTCYFDEEKCATGIQRLDNYRKAWNEKLGAYRNEPVHDDASHGADAFRTGAVGWKEEAPMPKQKRSSKWIR